MSVELPSYPLRAVHLAALWAYAVSQPVFSILEGNPELLAVRGSTRADVVLFAMLLALGPPVLAVGCEWLLARLSPWLANVLHVLFVCAFLVPVVVHLAKLVDPGSAGVALLLVSSLTVAGACAYLTVRAARTFLSFSLLLPVVGLVSFVVGMPVAIDEARADTSSTPRARTPIVLVVLDELPVASLMTRSGRIDEVRYPGFARLAREGTWYRRATTVHEGTDDAVASILTGRLPQEGRLPVLADHPQNLFTLLGGAYALDVHESWTRLCPLSLCPRDESVVARADDLLVDVGAAFLRRTVPRSLLGPAPTVLVRYEVEDAERFVAGLRAKRDPGTLHFAHLLVPHVPWRFLPSGREYGFGDATEAVRLDETWLDDPWLVGQAYQRHLLQVGYADALVGRVLREADRNGLYDRALVVVVADHGVSFRSPGSRRGVSEANLADIASVPLFVKYPRQGHGVVDDRAASTVDVLPTIADVVGARLRRDVDGRSLLDAPLAGREVAVGGLAGTVRGSSDAVARGVSRTVERKASLFGEGGDSLYAVGSNRWLLGSRVPAGAPRSATVRVRLEEEGRLADVRPGSGLVPSRVSAVVVAGELRREDEVAIAVNGRVRALTRCYWLSACERFRALVPESALRPGQNRVDVYVVEGRGRGARLRWIGGGPDGR